jgi:hypothetical protein
MLGDRSLVGLFSPAAGAGEGVEVLLSASGRACRYFSVVWIRAWRRSCILAAKSTPLALTAGCQMRVRKVLREIEVPALVVNSSWWRPMPYFLISCAAASSQSSSTPKVLGSLSLG